MDINFKYILNIFAVQKRDKLDDISSLRFNKWIYERNIPGKVLHVKIKIRYSKKIFCISI